METGKLAFAASRVDTVIANRTRLRKDNFSLSAEGYFPSLRQSVLKEIALFRKGNSYINYGQASMETVPKINIAPTDAKISKL